MDVAAVFRSASRRSRACASASDRGPGRPGRSSGAAPVPASAGGSAAAVSVVQGGVADGGEHLLLLGRGRPDVACGEVHGASRGEPPGARHPAQGPPPLSSPPPLGRHDSRDACPVRSLVPERFRGGCPFGAPRWRRGISPGRCRQLPRLPELTGSRQGHISSHRKTRTAITVSTAANPSRMPMAGSAEAGPVAPGHDVLHADHQVAQRQEVGDLHDPLRREGERDERTAQERHRQDDQVHYRGRGLLGLGERPDQQPDGQERRACRR